MRTSMILLLAVTLQADAVSLSGTAVRVVPAGLNVTLSLGQHVEGGTLAYLVEHHRIIFFGSMDYIESELTGLRPEVDRGGAGAERH